MKCYICKKNEGRYHPIYGYPVCEQCARKLLFRKIGVNLRKNKIRNKKEIRIFVWESSLKDLVLEYLNKIISKWKIKPKIIITNENPDLKIVPAEILFVYLLASFYDKKYFEKFLFLIEKNIAWNITEKEAEFITNNYKLELKEEFLKDLFNLFITVAEKNPSYYRNIISSIRFAYENKIFFF